MKVGERIKLYLVQNKISQKQVANNTGIDRDKLSLSLNGKRKISSDELELILYALDVPANTFVIPRAPNIDQRDSA